MYLLESNDVMHLLITNKVICLILCQGQEKRDVESMFVDSDLTVRLH